MNEQNIVEKALAGNITEEQAIDYMNEVCSDNALLEEILQMVAVSREIGAKMKVAFDIISWIVNKCGGNRALLAGVVALMISSGSLSAYEIKKGDTLWGLSGGDVKKVLAINPGLTESTVLMPGMKIALPSEAKVNSYTVAKGDTFGEIAQKYGIKSDELRKLNPQIKDINRLGIGDRINVPAGKPVKSTKPSSPKKDTSVKNDVSADKKADFIARVIYSETSTQCTDEEVRLICQVIKNRIGNRNFGGRSDAYGAVLVPNAFSAVKKHNKPWNEYSRNLNKETARDYGYAEKILGGDYSFLPGDSSIVYYHDKSIKTPSSWTNKYWKPVKVKETAHFVFYKIVPNK